jgi:hypothetical protein
MYYTVDIKTQDGRNLSLAEFHGGSFGWTADPDKKMRFTTLDEAGTMYDKTARHAVAKSTCVNCHDDEVRK